MRLRVVSDGTPAGTHIEDFAGNRIEGVVAVSWYCEVKGLATLSLTVRRVPVDVAAGNARVFIQSELANG